MVDFEENVEEMVGTTREPAGGDRQNPAGTRPAVPGTRPVTRRRRRLVTNEMAATSGVMYADEGPYTIDVRNVKKMVGTTREAVDGDRVRWGRDGDETGGPGTRPATRRRRRLVTNEMAATGGVMYTDEGELEFDENEMAALEGSV